jgi:NTE family protein
MSNQTLGDWLASTSYHLVLSSGFFGFYAHAGLMKALEERGCLPASIWGCSSGALIAGCYAAGMGSQQIEDRLLAIDREKFWDPAIGPGFLRGKLFLQLLRETLPVTEIEQCKIPVSISVFDLKRREKVWLQKGCLSTAIRASCSVPFLFWPVRTGGRIYLDGAVGDPSGLNDVNQQHILYHNLLPTRSWGKLTRRKEKYLRKHQSVKVIQVENLPKVGPFTLGKGGLAIKQAYLKALEALERPVTS